MHFIKFDIALNTPRGMNLQEFMGMCKDGLEQNCAFQVFTLILVMSFAVMYMCGFIPLCIIVGVLQYHSCC